ncbi:MAG: hypothetical protein FWC11_03555 [Firmicutes bacterium]|nr:hypothetical protein [Bacillota bacterium]MCL2255917.1 hypothetical protein [Bacillota bacterium]
MKILLTGYKCALMKGCNEYLKQKYEVAMQDEKKLNDFDKIKELFRSKQFDTVIFFALGNAALEFFRNIQYSSIINGVNKILLVTDPGDFDLSRDVEDADDNEHQRQIPTQDGGLEKYLLSLLASKDKITTTLRVFGLFGQGVDGELSKAVAKAKKSRKISIDSDKELSLLYVEDAVKIIDEFVVSDVEKGFFNVAPDYATTHSEVLKKAKAYFKKEGIEIEVAIKSNTPANILTANSEKLIAFLPENFRFTTLANAVNKTLKTY